MSDRQREGQPLNQALLAKFADLRLRLVQVDALVNMLALRPELLWEILPKLSEAANPEPTMDRDRARVAPQSAALRDPKFRLRTDVPIRRQHHPPKEPTGPIHESKVAVLKGHAEGLTSPQIADQLQVSLNTIKYHNAWLYDHFETRTAAGAVAKALRTGVIK